MASKSECGIVGEKENVCMVFGGKRTNLENLGIDGRIT